ncbi:MAG: hypothetical protein ACOVOR_05350 [Rhabdochlamydiaceae bacterium]
MKNRLNQTSSLKKLEHPLSLSLISHPMVAGISIGLFLGKQAGVVLFSHFEYQNLMNLFVILGSTLSGIMGYLVLWYSTKKLKHT